MGGRLLDILVVLQRDQDAGCLLAAITPIWALGHIHRNRANSPAAHAVVAGPKEAPR